MSARPARALRDVLLASQRAGYAAPRSARAFLLQLRRLVSVAAVAPAVVFVTEHLAVAEVDPAGPAAEAGIRPGDVIEQVNRKPVNDVAGLKAAVKASGAKPSLFLVTRKGGSLYLAVEPPRAR